MVDVAQIAVWEQFSRRQRHGGSPVVGVGGLSSESHPELRWLLALHHHLLVPPCQHIGHCSSHHSLIPAAALENPHPKKKKISKCGDNPASRKLPLLVFFSSLRPHLSIPQVANAEGLQQENVIAVERGGPGQYLGGLGVHFVGPSHLEQSGILFRVGHARSARAALETHTQTRAHFKTL